MYVLTTSFLGLFNDSTASEMKSDIVKIWTIVEVSGCGLFQVISPKQTSPVSDEDQDSW